MAYGRPSRSPVSGPHDTQGAGRLGSRWSGSSSRRALLGVERFFLVAVSILSRRAPRHECRYCLTFESRWCKMRRCGTEDGKRLPAAFQLSFYWPSCKPLTPKSEVQGSPRRDPVLPVPAGTNLLTRHGTSPVVFLLSCFFLLNIVIAIASCYHDRHRHCRHARPAEAKAARISSRSLHLESIVRVEVLKTAPASCPHCLRSNACEEPRTRSRARIAGRPGDRGRDLTSLGWVCDVHDAIRTVAQADKKGLRIFSSRHLASHTHTS